MIKSFVWWASVGSCCLSSGCLDKRCQAFLYDWVVSVLFFFFISISHHWKETNRLTYWDIVLLFLVLNTKTHLKWNKQDMLNCLHLIWMFFQIRWMMYELQQLVCSGSLSICTVKFCLAECEQMLTRTHQNSSCCFCQHDIIQTHTTMHCASLLRMLSLNQEHHSGPGWCLSHLFTGCSRTGKTFYMFEDSNLDFLVLRLINSFHPVGRPLF